MPSAVDIIFSSFLSQQPADRLPRLLQFLPNHERENLQKILSAIPNTPAEEHHFENLIEKVHWSWFLPTIRSYSPPEQLLFLTALDPSAAQALASEIPCKLAKTNISSLGRAYLRQLLLNSLVGIQDRILPPEYLPPSPFNQILKMSKNQIIHLIDLAAMHDLAIEIRQIVETKILKKIYSLLSEEQLNLLKRIAAKHEVRSSLKTDLDRWDGDPDALRHSLHKKGLIRLGIALSGQNFSLSWYICHMLDIGRGSTLFKLCEKEGSGLIVEMTTRQIEELLELDL